MGKPQILLSAYSCEPNKSSEPGVGWNWALHLADRCDVTVVTRKNNQVPIERECESNPTAAKIRWIYHDLNKELLKLKRLFKIHRIYYFLWQRSLEERLLELCGKQRFDIVQHLTFASYRYPTAISRLPCRRIWGPVGGAEFTPWNLLPGNSPSELVHECIRNFQTRKVLRNPKIANFDLILSSTHETQSLLSRSGFVSQLIPTIGIGEEALAVAPPNLQKSNVLRLLYVGNLQHLKGIHFVIEALALCKFAHFTIVGSGPYEQSLRRLVARCNVTERVTFTGFIPQWELQDIHRRHDVFVFPSLHDSGGIALLEAMASGMPSIVLACGGPRILSNSECGFQIAATNHSKIVSDIAARMKIYFEHPDLRLQHGQAALHRVGQHFLWKKKAETILKIYERLLGR